MLQSFDFSFSSLLLLRLLYIFREQEPLEITPHEAFGVIEMKHDQH